MSTIIDILKNIGEFILHFLSFPRKLYHLLISLPADVGVGLTWLPADCILIVTSILIVAVMFKVFGREG